MGHWATTARAVIIVGLMGIATAYAGAAPAAARTCTKNIAPPGHAGSTQYYETVPTSCGNASPPSTGGHGSVSTISGLGHGRAGVKTLSHLGAQGSAAAALAAATAPNRVGPPRPGSSLTPGASGGADSTASGRTPSLPSMGGSAGSALSSVLTGAGGGGLGLLLPILLGLTLVAAIGAGVLRARRSGGTSL
jgi:hypothetical protein